MRAFVLGLVGLFGSVGCGAADVVPPKAADGILHTATLEGKTYHLYRDGRLYEVRPDGWIPGPAVFAPEIVRRSYRSENGVTSRLSDEGKAYPVRRRFDADFRNLPSGEGGVRTLIGPQRGWTELTLQTPKTPTVPDYVKLRQGILAGTGKFLDARIESAEGGLRFECPPRRPDMICTKASISTGLVYFLDGDEFWYQADYRIEGPTRPLTLVDLESDLLLESAGIRVMLFPDGDVGAELKALNKPKFRQNAETRQAFPTDRWVRLTWAVKLGVPGRVRIWQDRQLVVDQPGQTIPFHTAIMNSLEVGISAHDSTENAATVVVRNLRVSDQEIAR